MADSAALYSDDEKQAEEDEEVPEIEPEVADGIAEMDPDVDDFEDIDVSEDSDIESSVDTIELSDDDFPDLPQGWEKCTNKKCPRRKDGGDGHRFYWDMPPNPNERWTLDYKWDTVELGQPTISDTDFVSCVRRWVSDEWLDDVTTKHFSKKY